MVALILNYLIYLSQEPVYRRLEYTLQL